MSENLVPKARQVTFHVTPFDAPTAVDFYANLTGVGNGLAEIVLIFAQALPEASVGENGGVVVPPRVRISLPVPAAQNLLKQLTQQLEIRKAIESESEGEDESVGV